MPHCIIEYSKELEDKFNPSQLIEKTYQGVLKSNLFIDSDIKTRAISFENYQTGNNRVNFINITVKILSGRSQKQREELSKLVLDEFSAINLKPLSITVEICEIEKETYSKLVL